MPEISAAWALAALDRADEDLSRWQEQALHALESSRKFSLDLFSPAPNEVGPYWVVRWPDDDVEMPGSIVEDLKGAGVEARRWWPKPCSSMPAFVARDAQTPNAHWLARNTIGLPMSIDMSSDDFLRVGDVLADILEGGDQSRTGEPDPFLGFRPA